MSPFDALNILGLFSKVVALNGKHVNEHTEHVSSVIHKLLLRQWAIGAIHPFAPEIQLLQMDRHTPGSHSSPLVQMSALASI